MLLHRVLHVTFVRASSVNKQQYKFQPSQHPQNTDQTTLLRRTDTYTKSIIHSTVLQIRTFSREFYCRE